MSGVEVATMIRSIDARIAVGGFERAPRGEDGEVAAGHVGRGEMAKADAGALDDPVVGGLDPVLGQARGEIGVADAVRAADSCRCR